MNGLVKWLRKSPLHMSSWFHSEFMRNSIRKSALTAGFPPGPAGMFQRRSQQGLRVAQLGEAVQEVGYLAKHGIRKPPCGFLSKKWCVVASERNDGGFVEKIRFADSCDWNKIVKYWDSIGFKQQKSGTSWDILDFTWRNLIYVVTIKIADSSALNSKTFGL